MWIAYTQMQWKGQDDRQDDLSELGGPQNTADKENRWVWTGWACWRARQASGWMYKSRANWRLRSHAAAGSSECEVPSLFLLRQCFNTSSDEPTERGSRNIWGLYDKIDDNTEITLGTVTDVVVTITFWISNELSDPCLQADSWEEKKPLKSQLVAYKSLKTMKKMKRKTWIKPFTRCSLSWSMCD